MKREKLTFAMGCFWGPEDRFARIPGVTGTRVGYSGGQAAGRPDGACGGPDAARGEADGASGDAGAARSAGTRFAGGAGTSGEAGLRAGGTPAGPAERSPEPASAPIPTHRRLYGHSEVVEVEFDPEAVTLEELLRRFWSEHNPAAIEGYKPEDPRYRSLLLYRGEAQCAVMERVRREMTAQGRTAEATELKPLAAFYPAEEKHQRYEEKKRRRMSGGQDRPATDGNGGE